MNISKAWLLVIVFSLFSLVALTGCGGNGGTAPATPSGVVATPGNGHATITWPAATNASSYNIYYSTTSANATKANGIKITDVTSPYPVTGLNNDGTTYYFVVTAVNYVSESAESPQASCTLAARPEISSITAGDGQATIKWKGVANAASYNIYWSTTPGVSPANATSKINVPASNLQTVVTGLTNETTYYFVVTSVDATANGESLPSNQTSVLPLPSGVQLPATPTVSQAVAGNGQVQLSWGAVSGATSYNIYWSNSGNVDWSSVTSSVPVNVTKITGVTGAAGAATISYTQVGLNNGVSYYYVVSAVASDKSKLVFGESPVSAVTVAMPALVPQQ